MLLRAILCFWMDTKTCKFPLTVSSLNSMWPNKLSGSTLVQVMAWCHQAPSHYLNQCWLLISKILWSVQAGILYNVYSVWWKLYFQNYSCIFQGSMSQGMSVMTKPSLYHSVFTSGHSITASWIKCASLWRDFLLLYCNSLLLRLASLCWHRTHGWFMLAYETWQFM